jgi:hypothetical protein
MDTQFFFQSIEEFSSSTPGRKCGRLGEKPPVFEAS